MRPTQSDRAGGLHFLHGRHPEHPRAALRSSRWYRIQHKSMLLLAAMDAIMKRYADQLDPSSLQALHNDVLAQLRCDLQDDWTPAEAIDHAQHVAAVLRRTYN